MYELFDKNMDEERCSNMCDMKSGFCRSISERMSSKNSGFYVFTFDTTLLSKDSLTLSNYVE